MRQVDGSDLLGQNDPRNAEIGILHIEPEDSRQEILTAINAQELLGRKQIAIVLPEQGKAFRQPVEFDGLKNMRRGLKAQLIFIAPSGPGPAEFARQRRFVVYSSLETFKTALLSERGLNPRAKTASGDEKKQGFLRGRASKERGQNSVPRVATSAPIPPVMPPPPPTPRISANTPEPPVAPPTPRIVSGSSAQPVMPPTPPTPRLASAFSDPENPGGSQGDAPPMLPPIVPIPIEEMETRTLEFDVASANTVEVDDDLALPPVTPRQPQGGISPDTPGGSGTPGGPKTPDARRSPTPLLLGQQASTPRPGSGKLPAATAQGSRTGTGKMPASAGRGGGVPGQGRGTKQLSGSQKSPDATTPPKQSNGKSGNTNKLPVIVPVGGSLAVPPSPGSSGQNPATATTPATSGTPGSTGVVQRQTGLTPLPPPVSRRRRRSSWRKRLLLAVLLIFTLLLVGGVIVSALGGPSGLASLGHLTATITITPQSQVVKNDYLLTGVPNGTPDPNQRQVAARVLTAQSGTKPGSGKATGSIPATAAQGTLTFQNVGGTGLTLGTTVLTGADGVQVKFFGPVFVPATGAASATATGYAISSGAAGNIQALDIQGNCCSPNIFVKNLTAFAGGQNAQPNSVIQRSDIDNAAKPVVADLQASTRNALQQQVKSNERVVDGSFACKPTTTQNHQPGDKANSVTVSVSVSCTEEVFDYTAAQRIASGLLPKGTNLTGYSLVGSVITDLVNSSQVSAQGQASITIHAEGKWVYQFTDQLKQEIRSKLVNHTKDQALNILRQYVGLATANVSISSGATMPANVNDITVNIVPVSGLQPGTPTGTSGTPGGSGGTPTGGSTPTKNATPTPRSTETPQIGS